MSKPLLLFPFGGNAREALATIDAVNRAAREWDVIGFLDDDRTLHGKEYLGVKVLGGLRLLEERRDVHVLAVPGSPKGYLKRKQLLAALPVEASRFATIVHPTAVLAVDARVGYNTVVMAHVVVSCAARVGNHCIVLPNTVIAHDSSVGDYCCVGSNVSVSGMVAIGEECYVGSGVKIREKVTIGSKSLLGLGANVIRDVGERVVAVGNPARTIRGAKDRQD